MFRHFHAHGHHAPHGLGRGHGRFGDELHREIHRGGRRGRMFDQGGLRLLILHLVSEKPRHGYEIIKAIEERLSGLYSPSPGLVYPTLTLLEEMGYVTVEPSDGKKLYTITEAGQAHLQAESAALKAVLERMDTAGAAFGGRSPQIMRAMENFRTALRLRLSRGPLSEEQIKAVAAELDAAAQRIESL